MLALNFQAEQHEELLAKRKKNCTVRLGDVHDKYPESSVVWITTGKKLEPKRKLFTAFIDRSQVKTMGNLTAADLDHQNPNIKTREDLIADFERIYQKRITMDDTVTVIYFSEITEA